MSRYRILDPSPSYPHRAWFVGTLAAIVIATGLGNAIAQPGPGLGLEAVSNRADLISSGNILVRVTLPPNVAANQAVLMLNGQPLANPLHPAPDGRGYLALVTGMNLGQNTLMLAAGGGTLQLDITNHPTRGPIYLGSSSATLDLHHRRINGLGAPLDANCNAPDALRVLLQEHRNAAGCSSLTIPPIRRPPSQIAIDRRPISGLTVPYIVRHGDRHSQPDDLHDHRALRSRAAVDPLGAAAGVEWQGAVPLRCRARDCNTRRATLPPRFDDNGLSRGFATAAAAMTNHGTIPTPSSTPKP